MQKITADLSKKTKLSWEKNKVVKFSKKNKSKGFDIRFHYDTNACPVSQYFVQILNQIEYIFFFFGCRRN